MVKTYANWAQPSAVADRTREVERPPIKFVYTRRGKRVNAELAKGSGKVVKGAELVGEGSGEG